ncbi:MAG: hypothetical protein HXX18_06965 [Bacteroidetes bacterium]|nr:hypothetical protein [Bacteroidota bacterium]
MKPTQYISNSYTDECRFGFNGQEKDREIYNNENTTTATFWEYDARIGRRWNIDPVLKQWESPYLCFSANPILYSDVLGDKIKGETKDDAVKAKQQISNTFENNKEFDEFFKISETDGKTFSKISANKFENFLDGKGNYRGKGAAFGLNKEKRALAIAYMKTVNADYEINVKFDDGKVGGDFEPTSEKSGTATIGLARPEGDGYHPLNGAEGEKMVSNRTAIFVHEVVGEGRVWGNTGNLMNLNKFQEDAIKFGPNSPSGMKLNKVNLEIIQTENLYNSFRPHGFYRSGMDHNLTPKDAQNVKNIPSSLGSYIYGDDKGGVWGGKIK